VTRPVYEVKAAFFKALGHPLRIRILEVLRNGEASVGELAEAVGVGGSTLSQHLAALRSAEIVTSQRAGSTVRYRVVDPRMFQVLESVRRILTTSLEGSQQLLSDLEELDFRG
jgi:ArsR family transcriptional regulator, arsenate/arsenite/antimonite-responsive transcriptional repressor